MNIDKSYRYIRYSRIVITSAILLVTRIFLQETSLSETLVKLVSWLKETNLVSLIVLGNSKKPLWSL